MEFAMKRMASAVDGHYVNAYDENDDDCYDDVYDGSDGYDVFHTHLHTSFGYQPPNRNNIIRPAR